MVWVWVWALGGVGVLLIVAAAVARRGLLGASGGLAVAGAAGLYLIQSGMLGGWAVEDYDDPARVAALRRADLTVPRPTGDPAKDWPQWRGPLRDGIARGVNLAPEWTAERAPRVVWSEECGKGYSSVSVAGGRVYLQDFREQGDRATEGVVCRDAATGAEVWSYRYPVDYRGIQSPANGPRATPTVHEGRVYTVGATGKFLCLDAEPPDGKPHVLWEHDLLAEFDAPLPSWGIASSPLIEGELVIVQPGGSDGTVVAFDRNTGELRWAALGEKTGYCSPLAATCAGVRQVIAFTAENLVGLRPEDGAVLWKFEWRTQHNANIAMPVVTDDYVFISSGYKKGCALLQLVPRGDGGVGVEKVWVRRRLLRNHFSSNVLHEGHLYGFDETRSELKCIDLRDPDGEKWASHGLRRGSVVRADGLLLVLTEDGTLALVEATPEDFRLKGKLEKVLNGSECWAPPALTGDGRAYVRDHTKVVCLELPRKEE